jgi:hypothetical protein
MVDRQQIVANRVASKSGQSLCILHFIYLHILNVASCAPMGRRGDETVNAAAEGLLAAAFEAEEAAGIGNGDAGGELAG